MALFVDMACPHCRAEYEFWRDYQKTLAARGVVVELQLFHFPRGCTTVAGVADVSRQRACDAARAHLCLGRGDPARSLAVFEQLFTEQAAVFSGEHLAAIAAAYGVDADENAQDSDLFACMASPQTADELRRHVLFGERVADLRKAPGALLVPLENGRPTGKARQVQGRKPVEFYQRWFDHLLQGDPQ